MKKVIPIMIALLAISLGVYLPNNLKLLRIILIIVGLIIGFSYWLYFLRGKEMVCPSCKSVFTWKQPLIIKMRNGMIKCPYCGTILQGPNK